MIKTLFLLAFILFATGCRWFEDKPLGTDTIDTDSLSTTCKLNIDNIKNYMTRRVDKDLDCMYDNIKAYRRNVYHPDPNLLKKDEMLRFINTYMYGKDEKDKKEAFDPFVIDILFKLNSLILGGSTDSVTYSQAGKFLQMMKIVNLGIQDFRDILVRHKRTIKPNRSDAFHMKNVAYITANNISTKLLQIIKESQSAGEPFLIGNIGEMFHNADMEKIKLGIRRFEIFKSFIFGGEDHVITQNEFNVFLKKLPVLASGIYDLFIEKLFSPVIFKKFFKQDITSEMNSLEANLLTFLRIRSEQVGTSEIFKEDLWELFQSFGAFTADSLMIELFYDVKSLIVGGEQTVIFFEELPDFSYVIKLINKSIQPLTEIFEQEAPGAHGFFASREIVSDVSRDIAIKMTQFIKEKQKPGLNFDLFKVKKLLDDLGYEKILEQYNSFLKYKPYFVGGKKNILTQAELKTLMDEEKFPILVRGIYDLSFVKREYFSEGVVGYFEYINFKRRAYFSLLTCVKFGKDKNKFDDFILKDYDLNIFLKEDLYSLETSFFNFDLTPELVDFILDLNAALWGGDNRYIHRENLADIIILLKIVDYELETMFSQMSPTQFDVSNDKEVIYNFGANLYFKTHSTVQRFRRKDKFTISLDSITKLLIKKYPHKAYKVQELLQALFEVSQAAVITEYDFEVIFTNFPEFISMAYVFINLDENLFNTRKEFEKQKSIITQTLLKYKNHFQKKE